MADSALKKKTTVSLFWSFFDKLGQQILNFASMLILMNIVSTTDYGLIGSLAIFVAFSTLLIDSGFGRALINRKNLTESDYSTVFYFNVSLGFILYLIFFFVAPALGNLFHAPAIVNVARWLFLSVILSAFGLIHQTLLIKKADFKGLTKVNMAALFLADVIAVLMAIFGYGVWALVAQVVLYALFRTVFIWIYSPWRPTGKFKKESLKSFFAFSHKLLFTGMISTSINNIYPSLIATFYPMSQVAFFNQAKKYQDIPFLTLSNTFRSVAMLILSEINDQTERLKRVVSKTIKTIAFLSFPIGFMMIAVAEPLFFLFFKEKWLPAVPFFQILTFAGMLLPFIFILNELFIAKENSRYFLGLEIVKGILLIALIAVMFPYGIKALAISWVIYMAITLMISTVLSGKLIRYSLFDLLKDILPYLVLAAVCTGISFFVARTINNNIIFIITTLLSSSVSYILLCKLLKLEMLKEFENWFQSKKKKK